MRGASINDAERQMVQHELAIFSSLFARVARRLSHGQEATEETARQAIEATIKEDPEARELAERVGVLQRFRGPRHNDREEG